MTVPTIQGWCPGAHRPMMSGDGLVVRIRPFAGEISGKQASILADLALDYGTGFIDLTNRANLQIRGVSDADYPKLMTKLNVAGLLDDSESLEDKRNIIITPFYTDGDLAHRLYKSLASSLSDLPAFPKKFGFAIDTGPSRCLLDANADIRLESSPSGDVLVRADGFETGVAVREADVIAHVHALLTWFMATRNPSTRRMAKHLGDTPLPHQFQGAQPVQARTGTSAGLLYMPFGQIDAQDLKRLAKLPGMTSIRVTPWRALLVSPAFNDAQAIFPERAASPLMTTSACAGKPFCPQASVETRALAVELAPRWSGSLHVSGCSKGCARPSKADVTLVGNNGKFDLVRNGAAWDDALYTNLSPTELKTLDLK